MYDFLKLICQPYLFLLLALGIGIVVAWRRVLMERRLLRWLFVLWLTILLLSMPPVSHLLLLSLEHEYEPTSTLPENVDVIVLLGGGTNPANEFRSYATVTGSSFYRCRHVADLYEQLGGRPVIVCGGQTDPADVSPTEAEVMRGVLVEMGVAEEDLILENKSESTHENATFASELIEEHGFENPLLVTHALHMKRAELCFRKQGVDVVPAACGFKTGGEPAPFYAWAIPSPETLERSHRAIREWVGIGWYWVQRRI